MGLNTKFGKKLKTIRESLMLSQEELAEKVGLHRNSIARIESGKICPSFKTVEKFKMALGVDYKDLFSFDNERIKKNYKQSLEFKIEQLSDNDAKYFIESINLFIKRNTL
ncbi:MAG: helix-turn-helix domain-containing protein [Candidatus Gastranaerophilales bacterium]|nr:helix-turn-helix domain-containing protein [Candidatus Gastranaerophilales bacterium]